jgi:ubiquinone/menaquinone biosynthesis C-methylase UbiE
MARDKYYTKYANKYDEEQADKNYKWEAEEIKQRITEWKKSKGNYLLDVGCGTGSHLAFLKKDYNCMGVDLYEEILSIARKKIDDVEFKQANMMELNLGKKFDVIVCLFSAIGYARNYINFRKTLRGFYNHLNKGGIAIIEPWYTKKVFKNFKGKSKSEEGLLFHEPSKWKRIMKEEGFKTKYFYRGLLGHVKGIYILRK